MMLTLMSDTQLVAPEYLSPSSITTFEQCPLKFKYSRIDKLVEPPTEATLRGNFVHDILEALYTLEPDQRTQDVAKEIARRLWDSTWENQAVSLISDSKKLHEFRWSAWWCVANLWNLEDPTLVNPSGIEKEVLVDIGGVTVRGFIDRYSAGDNGITVSDYKTGKTPHPRYQDGKFFQLLVYALAIQELDLGHVGNLELLFLKESVRLLHEVTPDDLDETKEKIVAVRSAIDARCKEGSFEPITHKLCDWCHFKSICPAWKGKR